MKWLVTFEDGYKKVYYGTKERVITIVRFCSDLMFEIEEVK